MRDKLTEAVGKPHLSYSSLKYALGDMRLWEMYMRGQLKKTSDALIFNKSAESINIILGKLFVLVKLIYLVKSLI